VVGPFHLAGALGLSPAAVGLVVSVGPLVVALAGVPAGRLTDRFGARPMSIAGLAAIASGCALLAMLPATLGIAGYVTPLIVITAGYALFQTANNTDVMADVPADRRGVMSGLVNLARNLGLITGASVMGAVFAGAVGAIDIAAVQPGAVATGTRITFAVAAALMAGALCIAIAGRRVPQPDRVAA
jgi:MFS family permease